MYAKTVYGFTNLEVGLNQHEYEALISFCFNVGINAFKRSTLLRRLNKGDVGSVPAQLARWVYAGGKKSNGLINRRDKEIQWFLYGR